MKFFKMAPYGVPTPHIVPLRIPFLDGPKSIDTEIKIELFCDTYIEHEVFYTLDGTKPQPYAGIVQGSKLHKYTSPFTLPEGKITVKAIALNARVHSMRSNVITKCFEVISAKPSRKRSKMKYKKANSKVLRNDNPTEEEMNSNLLFSEQWDVEESISRLRKNKEIQSDDTPNPTDADDVSKEGSISDDFKSNSINSPNENLGDFNNLDASDKDLSEIEDEISVISFDDDKATKAEAVQLNDTDAYILKVPEFSSNVQNDASNFQPCCIKCKMCVQPCFSCSRVNAYENKYCIECGEKLSKVCYNCHEPNACIATFCQYCGKKLDSDYSKVLNEPNILQNHQSILAKPEQKDIGIQKLPTWMNKYTQTRQFQSEKKNDPKDLKASLRKLPPHSPGRGYWHQQLDFICNHLKSHAYNNLEFRQVISEPSLSDFQSVRVVKDENQVAVTIIFSPYVKNS